MNLIIIILVVLTVLVALDVIQDATVAMIVLIFVIHVTMYLMFATQILIMQIVELEFFMENVKYIAKSFRYILQYKKNSYQYNNSICYCN